jgi:hypothetical protein
VKSNKNRKGNKTANEGQNKDEEEDIVDKN